MRGQTRVIFFYMVIISIGGGHVNAEDGTSGVSFWRETFTMTCPEEGDWYRMKQNIGNKTSTHTIKYNDASSGLYYCEYPKTAEQNQRKKYYFYVEGRVCSDCFELDGLLFVGVIIGDVLFTMVVMFMIYKYGRSKNTSGPRSSKSSSRSGGKAQPSQSPVYEPLSPHTREDLYSLRTG
ncbi:T-cell surface glycoprotein CD3 epsilon chain-like [Synchiropus picturatus]